MVKPRDEKYTRKLRDIGKECRSIREDLGLTQAEVGKAIGYTQRSISDFECGKADSALILWYYVDTLVPEWVERALYDRC